MSHQEQWWRRLQPTSSIITDTKSIDPTYTILLCKDDIGSVVEPTSSLVWADVILADFQGVISRFLQDISTYLSVTAQWVLRTTFTQKSKPKYACLTSKIVEVWIDRFCVPYDWWRRLQPTSSVSPVCYVRDRLCVFMCVWCWDGEKPCMSGLGWWLLDPRYPVYSSLCVTYSDYWTRDILCIAHCVSLTLTTGPEISCA